MAVITGTNGAETIVGGPDDDLIEGFGGNDLLIGAGGSDTTDGGTGDDVHLVENANDIVIERASEGDDRILASVSYILGADVFVETLTTANADGAEAINLTGNNLAQSIYGNAGNNVISGDDSGDYLVGGTGDDRLTGGAGADWLDGGAGDDVYYIEDTLDSIVETGDGWDEVYTSADFRLRDSARVELISTYWQGGTEPINLAGNGYDNYIIGNAGANTLSSEGGADVLAGLAGDDNYHVSDGREEIFEAADGGWDTLYASTDYTLRNGAHVEVISTYWYGATDAIDLTGNEQNNRLYGNAGANFLDGGLGNDVLVGMEGADTFAFTTDLGSGNVDTIWVYDYMDRIALDADIFRNLPLGTLPEEAFKDTRRASVDYNDRILFDGNRLWYDVDGHGTTAPELFAVFQFGYDDEKNVNWFDFILI